MGAVPVVCCNRVYLITPIRLRCHQCNAAIVELSSLSQVRPAACCDMGVEVLRASVLLVELDVNFFLLRTVCITYCSVDNT